MTRLALPDTSHVVALYDAGNHAAAIAERTGVSVGYIYGILRAHRPGRPRKARRSTTTVPLQVRALAATGTEPPRIAMLLGCTRQYVYRILST